MEENKKEIDLMSEEEFKDYLKSPRSSSFPFFMSQRFKSINRAIKRGNLTPSGVQVPKRPFNNRANTSERKGVHSRTFNELRKKIYEDIKSRRGNTTEL